MRESSLSDGGRLCSGLADEPAMRWAAVDLRGPLRDACGRLDLSPVAAGALGRCLAGAVLLQRMTVKASSRLVLGVSGDGPLSQVLAEVDEKGDIRGMVSAPRIELPLARTGELGVGRAIGNGLLRVWRQGKHGSYQSQVDLKAGRIGEALTHYLEQSEQSRSAVLLGVLAESDGISSAGGIMLEALPGSEDEVVARFEEHLHAVGSVSRILARQGIEGLVEATLGSSGYRSGEEREIHYRCRCSPRSMESYLSQLDERQLAELRKETGELDAECVFCGRHYRFAGDGSTDRLA